MTDSAKLVNMTPHDVVVLNSDNTVLMVLPKTDSTVRLSVNTVECEPLGKVPTSKTVFGDAVGLPDFEENTYYVVSQLVKSALPHREDLLVPADVVRDEKGLILGCRSLGR